MSLDKQNILASQRVGIATTAKVGSKFQIMAGNRFRRFVTFNNSGSALVDTLIAIPVDHRGIYNTDRKDKHTTRTFNDLRILQDDESTPIPFYLEGVDTHSCSVFVRLDIPAGESKIILEYGNPALEPLSDPSVVPSTITDSSTIVHNWNASHITSGNEVLEVDTGSPIMNLHNSESRAGAYTDVYNEAPFAPIYSRDGANGHACLQYFTNKTLGVSPIHKYSKTLNKTQISIYVVAKASTIGGYNSIYRNQAGQYIVYPFGSGASSQFIVSTDGGTSGINTGFVANEWNIGSAHYSKNTTNGMRTYRNNAIVAQRNSVNVDIPSIDTMYLGSFGGSSEYTDADVAQVIVCYNDNFSTTEQADKRDHIYEYLNAKYRTYAGLEDVTITVESEIEVFKNINDENIYEFSNVGKQSWQDKILDIELDTASLISAGRMRSDCGDIRVFDEKGVPLPYFLIQPNTAKTKIIFKIPEVEAGETFRIKVTYNIPGRASGENKSAVIPACMQSSDVMLLAESHNYTAGAWANDAGDDLVQATTGQQPTLVSDQLNGLPAVRFDGVDDVLTTASGLLNFKDDYELSMYIILKNTNNANNTIQWFRNNDDLIAFPYNGAVGEFSWFRGGISPDTNPAANQWQILGLRLNASQAIAYRNFASTDQATPSGALLTAYANLPFTFGQGTQDDIAAAFVTSSYLTDDEVQEIKEYYAALYHFYDEVWLVNTLVSSTQDVANTGFTYEYLSGVSRYNINSEIEGDIGSLVSTASEVEIDNVFSTTLTDSFSEQYTASTLSKQQLTNTYHERLITASTSMISDTCSLAHFDDTYNRATFSTWQVYDDVDATKYRITDDDYVSLVMHVEDASLIDYTTSDIRLYNDNTISSTITDWTVANEWGQAELGIADPFGGNNALKYTPTANGGFIKFLDEAVDPVGFTGVRTISVYVRLSTSANIRLIAYGSGFAGAVVDDCDTSKVGQWQRLTVTTDGVTNYRAIALWGEPAWASASGPVEIFAPTNVSGTLASAIPGSCDYSAPLPTLVDGINYIRIPRSSFVGSGAFSEISFAQLNIRTTSGTQQVAYSQLRYDKNYQADTRLSEGSLVDITLASSDDDRATWDILPISNQVIEKIFISDKIDFQTVDFISLLEGLKFKHLPSWHGENMIFRYTDLTLKSVHKYMIHELLSMIFPSNFIDTETTDGDVDSLRYAYLAVNKEEFVKDKLEAIIKANVGVLYYNANTAKITYKSGTEIFDQTAINADAVVSYGSDTRSTKNMFNRVEARPLVSEINNSSGFVANNYIGGANAQAIEIQAHANDAQFSRVKIPLTEFKINGVNDDDLLPYVQRAYISGINFATSATGGLDNTNITITKLEVVDNEIVMNVTNRTGAVRYLNSISLIGQFMAYSRPSAVFNPDVKLTYETTNQVSIRSIGQSTYSLDDRFAVHDFITNTWDTVYTDLFTTFGLSDRYILCDVIKTQNINVGDTVRLLDQYDTPVTGIVVAINENEDFTLELQLRVI